jgi:PGF-CTERM protein
MRQQRAAAQQYAGDAPGGDGMGSGGDGAGSGGDGGSRQAQSSQSFVVTEASLAAVETGTQPVANVDGFRSLLDAQDDDVAALSTATNETATVVDDALARSTTTAENVEALAGSTAALVDAAAALSVDATDVTATSADDGVGTDVDRTPGGDSVETESESTGTQFPGFGIVVTLVALAALVAFASRVRRRSGR